VTIFNLPNAHRFTPPSVDERLDHLTVTAESHGQALRRIEAGLLVLIDRVIALGAHMDATDADQ
jgi:hypothetical protein